MVQKKLVIWNAPDVIPSDTQDRYDFICSMEDFNQHQDWDDYSLIFLLLELKWEGHVPSNFFGFKILEKIRLKKVLNPIMLCSALPKDRFPSTGKHVVDIFKTPGHYFLRLPASLAHYEPTEKIKSLTPNLLADINYHFFDLAGSVSEIFHNLKDKVSRNPQKETEFYFQILQAIIPDKHHLELDSIRTEMLIAIEQRGKSSAASVVNSFKQSVLELLPSVESQSTELEQVSEWQALCIDDNPDTLNKIIQNLKLRGIPCQGARSGEEAFDILEKDYHGELEQTIAGQKFPPNSITV
ncbi:MAG: hypothetical protein DWQ02_20920, partial [Bacteroidetes bacterium]